MGYTDVDRKRKLSEAVHQQQPPKPNQQQNSSSPILNGAKVSIARWFYQRLFLKKSQNTIKSAVSQTPLPTSFKEPDTKKDVEMSESRHQHNTTKKTTPSGELANMVREVLDETKLSVVIVGPNSTGKTQLLNALVQASCVSDDDYAKDHLFSDAVIIENTSQSTNLNELSEDKTFLLPQGRCGNLGKPVLLRYGKLVELVVTFHKESDIPQHIITNVVRPFLGKSFQCQGSGASFSQDLQFIRNRIKELMAHYGPFIRECKVSAPCSLLQGERNVIELSDLHAVGADLLANLLIITHDHRGLTQEVLSYLRRNNYVEKLAQKPQEHKVVFVENTETGCIMNQNILLTFKQFMIEEGLNSDLVDRIASETTTIMIKPHLFASLQFGSEMLEKKVFEEIKISTQIPLLLAIIENMQLSLNANTLSSLNEKWMTEITPDGNNTSTAPSVNNIDKALSALQEKANTVLKMLQQETPMGPEYITTTSSINTPTPGEPLQITTTTTPRIANISPEKISTWKEDLVNSLGQELEQKAGEWNEYLQSYEGKQLLQQSDACEAACGSLMRSAPEFWKQTIVGQIDPKLQEILNTSSGLLRECLSQVGSNPKEATTLDKIRLRKLNEFCNRVHQRTTQRVKYFKEMLEADANELVQTACSEVLESKFGNQQLPEVSLAAAKNIQQKFSNLLGAGLQQLVAVTKELDSSALTVLTALQTRPDTHLAIAESYRRLKQEEVLLFKDRNEPWAVVSGARTAFDEVNTPMLFTPEGWHLLSRDSDSPLHQSANNYNQSLRNKTRFLEQLKNAGLVVYDVIADGNSQFRALAHQVYGSQDAHVIVRVLVMVELLTNYSRYEKFLAQGSHNLHEYVYRMSKENEIGDHITLSAFSNFYGADLLVYGPVFARPLLVQPVQRRTTQVHCIAYVDDNHCQSLISQESEITRKPGTESQLPKKRRVLESSISTPTPMFEIDTPTGSEKMEESAEDNESDSSDEVDEFVVLGNDIKMNKPIISKAVEKKEEVIEMIEDTMDVDTKEEISTEPIGIDVEPNSNNMMVQSFLPSCSSCSYGSNRRVATLLDLCTHKLVKNHLHLYPSVGHQLPEELIQHSLSTLISINRLDSISLELLVTSRLSSLRLDFSTQLNDNLCRLIANNCVNLASLSLASCTRVTSEGVSSLLRGISRLETLNLENCINIGDTAIHTLISHHGSWIINVNLRGCTKISEDVLSNLMRSSNSLQSLTLRECHITDGLCNQTPPTLVELDLTDCQRVGDVGLISVSRRCPNLRQLRVGAPSFRSHITDPSLLEISENCQYLSEIDLTGCDLITDKSVDALATKCQYLQSLNLAGCKGVTRLPQTLPSTLKHLDVSRCLNVTDCDVTRLTDCCRGLENINLSACEEVSDEGLFRISKTCPNLREINLSSCGRIGDDGVRTLANHCPYLEKVTLYNCSRVTDEAIGDLSKCCSNLSSLDVSSCEQITDKSLSYLAKGVCAGQLRVLCLEETQASDSGLADLSRGCNGLTTLKLAYCRAVTDSGLQYIARGCSLIQCLDLSYCNGIKLDALRSALDRWHHLRELHLRGYVGIGHGNTQSLQHKNLRTLDLSWCKQLDDDAVARLGIGCPNMKDLDLAWCGRITARAVVSLSQNCPDLHHLNLRGCTRVSFLTTGLLPSTHIRIYR